MANEIVQKYVKHAEEARLWGTIELDFQEGQITLIRRTETFKPPREQPRAHGDYNRT
jgi:hypothetical protein